MAHRPSRLRIINELGAPRTLPAGPESFARLDPVRKGTASPGGRVLVLGLGPDPAAIAALLPPGARVAYVECPAFAAHMPSAWRDAVPRHWEELPPDAAASAASLCADAAVFLYEQAPRLFPSFWGPVLGACRLALQAAARPGPRPEPSDVVVLPGSESGLLIRELTHAFASAGFTVLRVAPDATHRDVPALLADVRPRLFVSVNFQGLDAHGELYHLLEAAGTRVCAWCVDNPWHLVSGLKSPFWKRMRLFVTDASFLPGLRAHGATHLTHLPLAAWPEGFGAPAAPDGTGGPCVNVIDDQAYADLATRIVFVGRTAFPGKQGFFSGCRPPDADWAEAQAMLAQGQRPDFFWWVSRVAARCGSLRPEALWPGNGVRVAGLGAEEAGRAWRGLCVRAANRDGLATVFGDDGWRGLAPDVADLRGPLDYYGPLAAVYRHAGCVLNATSLLLPAGLTQRHFDVWIAGGTLVSDATPGLDIFPEELVAPMRVARAAAIPDRAAALMADPARRAALCAAWRAHLLARHTYAHRVATLLRAAAL
ncbi:MAG: glycosyltransferase [Desulfovibrionaceae bacterium]